MCETPNQKEAESNQTQDQILAVLGDDHYADGEDPRGSEVYCNETYVDGFL